MQTNFEIELQELKPHDTVQTTEKCRYTGHDFIYTAGHGYLTVPKRSKYYAIALKLCEYGSKGKLAVYLEEDCEAPEICKDVEKQKAFCFK